MGINLPFEAEYKISPVVRTERLKWSRIICIRTPYNHNKGFINIYVRAGTLSYCVIIFVLAREGFRS